jgi:hypothetical protein
MELGTPKLWSECREDPLAFKSKARYPQIGTLKDLIPLIAPEIAGPARISPLLALPKAACSYQSCLLLPNPCVKPNAG